MHRGRPFSPRATGERTLFAFTTQARRSFVDARFAAGDWLVFGAEAAGLPAAVVAAVADDAQLRLPMIAGQRSLNLSNSVAVAVFEAWRQNGFAGSGDVATAP